jgi:hypothetical protein
MKRTKTHLAAALSAAIAAGGLMAVSSPANALIACNPRTDMCWRVTHRNWNRPYLVYHADVWQPFGPWRWRGGGYYPHRRHYWRRHWRHHWRRH